jgi:hypothetical protein
MSMDAATRPVTAVLTPAGSPTILATDRARQTNGTALVPVHAAVRVPQPFDPEGEMLRASGQNRQQTSEVLKTSEVWASPREFCPPAPSPAAIAAYFAQDGSLDMRG